MAPLDSSTLLPQSVQLSFAICFCARFQTVSRRECLLTANVYKSARACVYACACVQVDPAALPSYFDKLHAEGYTIVGLEQTASSRVLGSFSFPQKTALLLGAEKEGIPALFMAQLDVCVEIPQARNTELQVFGSLGL